jgi:hypothetical protein
VPGVDENREVWGGTYDWPESGDEWSTAWGGTDAQWHASVFPRVQPFLPARTLLEIAPGFGRWSQYLIPLSERYIGVDLAAAGVEACRRRFAGARHAEFHVNDGRSLAAVPDGSVDLAFSFDSLVHVESDVIGAYLVELSRKLTEDGIVFLHHSNLGACKPVGRATRLAIAAQEKVRGRPAVGLDHWRARSMTAETFVQLSAAAGLVCVGQEVVPWLGSRYLDCISVATRPGSRWARPNVVSHNPYFMAEAASSASLAAVFRSFSDDSATRLPSAGGARYFGPSSTMITSSSVGPWAVSVLGPWPKWRELVRRRARAAEAHDER